MKRAKSFVRTSILGGLVVILPATIFILAVRWLFLFVTGALRPLTSVVTKNLPLAGYAADLIVILVILGACFFVGLFVRTRLGNYLYHRIETSILKKAPGYKMIKEVVNQFLGGKKTPFSSVALVQIFENTTLATAFITDTNDDGTCTVFVPTGPNPTSGLIYHLQPQFVHKVNVPVEEAMRSIISCGAGSELLINAHREMRLALLSKQGGGL